jgi:hypothetical protein
MNIARSAARTLWLLAFSSSTSLGRPLASESQSGRLMSVTASIQSMLVHTSDNNLSIYPMFVRRSLTFVELSIE